MLPKKKRVTKEIFQTITKGGKTFSTPFFLFFYTRTDIPQYAFVAPQKIFKTAVIRNKYRRIGYNILNSIHIKQGSGVFFYKKEVLGATHPEIKENILFILKKVGLIY
jgi:ribonuclease P protein component